jgi:hypothetical protein
VRERGGVDVVGGGGHVRPDDARPATYARQVGIVEDVLAEIDAAFAAAPRPSDDALLHDDCFDDNDIAGLYRFDHWRDVPDAVVSYEYAALSFLSPAGYRHFIPAYMSFALRELDSGENAVDSTIRSLGLDDWSDERMRAFTRSKWSLLDGAQRAAVLSFLRAVAALDDERDEDVARALPSWDGTDDGSADTPEAVAARAALAEADEAAVEAWFAEIDARDAYALGELELMDVLRVGARRYAVMATTLDGAYFTAVVELGDDGQLAILSDTVVRLPGLDDD